MKKAIALIFEVLVIGIIYLYIMTSIYDFLKLLSF